MTASPVQPSALAAEANDARRARRALLDALRRNDIDAADAALTRLGDAAAPDLLEPIAMVHLGQRRWAEAAAALDRLPRRDAHLEALRLYARNLTAMRRHRPALHDRIVALPASDRYEVVRPSSGPATIVHRTSTGAARSVTPGGDVKANVRHVRQMLAPQALKLHPVGVAGVADGYVISDLAAGPSRSTLGAEQLVMVLEPEAALFNACLMLHDWSGDGGPIASPRFVWCVGPDWAAQLDRLTRDEPCLALPGQLVAQSPQTGEIGKAFRALAERLGEADAALGRALSRAVASRSAADFARAIRGDAGRKPRAMLLTSRFTTVLQHSTRDVADALAALGWDARVLIEPAAHLHLTARYLRRQLADFQPDVVFVIDHLRYEYGDLVPPQLPFVCWIQDNLPNLTSAEAGASIGSRDFVITNAAHMYQERWGYPSRQCVFGVKATRLVQRPAAWVSDGFDLAYVSNCSRPPAELLAETLATFPDPPVRAAARACGEAMIEVYARGGCLHYPTDIVDLLEKAVAGAGQQPWNREALQATADLLWHPLNDTLYRQQVLGWVADAADEQGLSLGLFGRGWEEHDRFGRYARGYIAYGDELEELTRRTRINLQIVPYNCLHQRLLDGITAGGFFLIRDHPTNHVARKLRRFLAEHAPDAEDTPAALAALAPHQRATLEALLAEHRHATPYGDPVALVRPQERWFVHGSLPHLEEVAFDDAASLQAAIRRFIADADTRRRISDAQLAFVREHLTYDALWGRVLGQVAERLETSVAPGATPS